MWRRRHHRGRICVCRAILLVLSIVLLLLLSRPEEALEYGRSVYEAAIFYLPDTLEQIYATELYASCLNGVGKIEEAREMFNKALREIETEISEAEVLRDGIKEKLK